MVHSRYPGNHLTDSPAFKQLCSFENLWLAWRRAVKRKRSSLSAAVFESRGASVQPPFATASSIMHSAS